MAMRRLPVEMTDDNGGKDDNPRDDDKSAHLLRCGQRSLGLYVPEVVRNLWGIASIRVGVACEDVDMTNAACIEKVGVDPRDDAAAQEGADEDHHSAGVHDDGERESAGGIEADDDIEDDRTEPLEERHGPEILHPEAGGQMGIENDIVGDEGCETDEQEDLRVAFEVVPAKTEYRAGGYAGDQVEIEFRIADRFEIEHSGR